MLTRPMRELVPLIEQFASARILCVGDLMLDRFIYGDVSRISPEAPIPVLKRERESIMLGGAGNVVRNIISLGAECCFISVIGDDAVGHQLTRLVGEEERPVRQARICAHTQRLWPGSRPCAGGGAGEPSTSRRQRESARRAAPVPGGHGRAAGLSA